MATRKITIEIPEELLEKAQRATKAGITETVREGLKILAASEAYARALKLQGKYKFSITLDQMKDDR
jgi:hypothetical protein